MRKQVFLLQPKEQVRETLRERVEKGKTIRTEFSAAPWDKYLSVSDKHKIWSDYNVEYLGRAFSDDSIEQEYLGVFKAGMSITTSKSEIFTTTQAILNNEIVVLESIVERLELIPEKALSDVYENEGIDDIKTVFIVHGQDDGLKETVARFIEKLELKAIILHEQPNKGATLIEKLERESKVGFAVILLNPDDVAYSKSEPNKKEERARQNVIFELGFFIGKFGRSRVCTLYIDNTTLPTDYLGSGYISFDKNGDWRQLLARELKAAGLDFDSTKLIN